MRPSCWLEGQTSAWFAPLSVSVQEKLPLSALSATELPIILLLSAELLAGMPDTVRHLRDVPGEAQHLLSVSDQGLLLLDGLRLLLVALHWQATNLLLQVRTVLVPEADERGSPTVNG